MRSGAATLVRRRRERVHDLFGTGRRDGNLVGNLREELFENGFVDHGVTTSASGP